MENGKRKTENLKTGAFRFPFSIFRFPFLLILAHLAVTLPLGFFLNVWMDEASTLYTTQNGFLQTFQNVFADEKQAPFYFLLLSLWRTASDSIFFARLLSIVFSGLAIKFFYDLARRLFDENAARFVSVLFALHPFLIWASVEIRGYSLAVLLSVLLLKLFVENFYRGDAETQREFKVGYSRLDGQDIQDKKNFPFVFFRVFSWLNFVFLAIVALYTNYYLGFLLAGFFVALLVAGKFKEARWFFLQMLIVFAAITPLLWTIKQQFAANAGGFQPDKSFIEGARLVWNHALNLTFPTELSPQAESSIISVVRIWLVRFGVFLTAFLLVKNNFRQINKNILSFGAISFVVAAFLFAAYFLLGETYVALRHTAVLFAPLFLFVALFFNEILPRRSWIFFAAAFAFLSPYSVYQSYPQGAKRGDWIRVARFIEANEKPNQPIIVFQNYDALSLPFHYQGANKILPDEKFFAWSFETNPSSEAALEKQIEFVISEIPAEADEIWLATEEICQAAKTRIACQPLENYVQANYTIEKEQDFYLERVRLLRKKPR
jgi:4-amino-4-deoxy-L-arabinose transferase-like glycosyltransferase